MSKTKSSSNTPAGEKRGADVVHASKRAKSGGSSAAVRETIESVVIAFVLAFLFRTFEAEAFVIPTGSMAPTLMGRHKDFDCPHCGYNYQVGASEEVDPVTNRSLGDTHAVIGGRCPICRGPAELGPGARAGTSYPSYKGDRILVGKFAYQFNEPERWDVAVFRYPGDAQTNYIKRLTGLPNETVRIHYGDIFTQRGDGPYEIARKPPEKLLAMLQPVYDNDLTPKIASFGWPLRWQPETESWVPQDDSRSYETDGSDPNTAWLRYSHLAPTPAQWNHLRLRGSPPANDPVEPGLIEDFTAYNSSQTVRDSTSADMRQRYWVGDLALECNVDVKSTAGELIFELIKGGRSFQCRIDVGTGQAVLSIDGVHESEYQPTATTALRGPGRYAVRFANCDQQLRLWIDGTLVIFGESDATTQYDALGNHDPQSADLQPVGVGSRGAAVRVDGLNILRDLYYIGQPGRGGDPLHPSRWRPGRLANAFSDFRLEEDQFLALGDNSDKSRDSRLWARDDQTGQLLGHIDHYVHRDLLIGKAFFIYWPHSWNRPVPFWPNFARMGFVR
jgi:signal peptidase I